MNIHTKSQKKNLEWLKSKVQFHNSQLTLLHMIIPSKSFYESFICLYHPPFICLYHASFLSTFLFMQEFEPYFLPMTLKHELDVVSKLEDSFSVTSFEIGGQPVICNIKHKSNQDIVFGDGITITRTEGDIWTANIAGRERRLMLNSTKKKQGEIQWSYFENSQFQKERSDKMFTKSFGLENDEFVWRIKSIRPDQHLNGVFITKTFVCRAARTSKAFNTILFYSY